MAKRVEKHCCGLRANFEENAFEFFSLATREAGKTLIDAIGELREAVDFLRYYANDIPNLKRAPLRGYRLYFALEFPVGNF